MTLDEKIKSQIIEDALNSVGTDIDGNISALSLADYIYGRIQNSFQSRVKELEESNKELDSIAQYWIDTSDNLQRKLEVARGALIRVKGCPSHTIAHEVEVALETLTVTSTDASTKESEG